MKERLTNNLGYKVLSIVLAVIMWLIMVNVSNPIVQDTREVPIEVLNESVLESSGLTYELVGKKTVTVSYDVRIRDQYKIASSDFYASADLAELYDVTGAIPVTVEVANREVKAMIEGTPSTKPGVVRIQTEPLQQKKFTLYTHVTGKPQEGFATGAIATNPEYVYATGAESDIGKINSLGIVVNVEGAYSDMTGSAAVKFYDSNGNVTGMMCVDISMNDVMEDRHDFLMLVIGAVVLTMLVICAVIVYLVGKTVVSPVNQLAQAAESYVSSRIAGTDLENLNAKEEDEQPVEKVESAISKLDIHTGDEIEALANAFKTMEHELEEYIQNLTAVTAEKERIGAELNVATQIQASMLPNLFPAFPERQEFDVYATMDPAKEVGGDFYDFFLVDDKHLAFVIADVSGKGIPAALFMVIAKTMIKNQTLMGKDPKEVLEVVNNRLCEHNDAGMFVTGWLGILDLSTNKLSFANAGHNPPLLKRAEGAFEYLRTRPGLVLAAMEGMPYQIHEIDLYKDDMLFLYTDGVTEATNAGEELYGEDRLQATLDSNGDKCPKELLAAIKADIDLFVGEAPQFDDITMLCIKIGG